MEHCPDSLQEAERDERVQIHVRVDFETESIVAWSPDHARYRHEPRANTGRRLSLIFPYNQNLSCQ